RAVARGCACLQSGLAATGVRGRSSCAGPGLLLLLYQSGPWATRQSSRSDTQLACRGRKQEPEASATETAEPSLTLPAPNEDGRTVANASGSERRRQNRR